MILINHLKIDEPFGMYLHIYIHMNLTEIETRIEYLEAQLSETNTIDDVNRIQYELLNLRFLKRLKILQQKANRIKEEPTNMEILNKYLHFIF